MRQFISPVEIAKRLGEPSTHASIAAAVTAIGMLFDIPAGIVAAIVSLFAVLGALMPERSGG